MAIDISRLKKPKVNEQGLSIIERLSADDIDLQAISRDISQDLVLTSTLIRYANSPLYRRSKEITNVKAAINALGLKNIRKAVFVATMGSFCSADTQVIDMIWEHSYSVSNLARMLALRCCRAAADDIEFTALMHDMGMLVLATNFPDEYAELAAHGMAENIPFHLLEKEIFGVDHDEVLVAMADDLRIPVTTREALFAFHTHAPMCRFDSEVERHVAVVSLAHLLEERVYSPVGHLVESIVESAETLQLGLGIPTDDLENLLEDYEGMLAEKHVV